MTEIRIQRETELVSIIKGSDVYKDFFEEQLDSKIEREKQAWKLLALIRWRTLHLKFWEEMVTLRNFQMLSEKPTIKCYRLKNSNLNNIQIASKKVKKYLGFYISRILYTSGWGWYWSGVFLEYICKWTPVST